MVAVLSADAAMSASRGRVVGAAILASTTGVLPMFLLGGLSFQIVDELGVGATQIGGLVTTFFTIAAVSSTLAGRVTERLGAYRSLATAAGCSALALLGVGLAAPGMLALTIWLALAGLGSAIIQPASNLLIARGVSRERQGLAFGFKQASIPLASLLAGLSVPAVGVTIGWRWAFLLAVAGPVAIVVMTPRIPGPPAGMRPTGRVTDSSARSLVVLAAATGSGTAAATMLSTFIVATALERGTDPSNAGLLLALGSAVGVVARVIVGARADARVGGHLGVVRWLMALGAAGFIGLAVPTPPAVFVVATLVAFGAGWGWNGLLIYAVVQANRSAPAAATGITQTGLYVGGMTGPLLFGLISDRWSFAAGWWLGAALLLIGVLCVLAGERWLDEASAGSPRAAGGRPGAP